MEVEGWKKELLEEAEKVMIQGGELHLIVIRRGNGRKPIVRVYPRNERILKEETLSE